MSTVEPVTEPFAGKQTDQTCPNCGSPLFSGLANGNILVCRDADGGGCQKATDPDNPDGATLAPSTVDISKVQASPEVGPANEAPDSTAGPGYGVAATEEAWEPPTSAPQAVNAAQEEAVQPVTPVPPPTVVPPVVGDKTKTTGDTSGSTS
jgi:hypothetical protein